MSGTDTSPIEQFQEYFSVQLARTPAQKADVFRIRYRVYCEQFGYEPIENFPSREEYDEYDDRSMHCLVVHKRSGRTAGCVRLVPTWDDFDADPLPLEKFCLHSLDLETIRSLNLERHTVCEVSRLAVDDAFRRRTGEHGSHYGGKDAAVYTEHERRTFPLVCVSGFFAATALTQLTGRPNTFAMMEPFLPRMLRKSGIVFQPVGDPVDYHGIRAPYFTDTHFAVRNMQADLKAMYMSILDQIQRDLP